MNSELVCTDDLVPLVKELGARANAAEAAEHTAAVKGLDLYLFAADLLVALRKKFPMSEDSARCFVSAHLAGFKNIFSTTVTKSAGNWARFVSKCESLSFCFDVVLLYLICVTHAALKIIRKHLTDDGVLAIFKYNRMSHLLNMSSVSGMCMLLRAYMHMLVCFFVRRYL